MNYERLNLIIFKPVLEPAYAPPYYRNPLLAQAMVHFKMIDTASMGIRRVYSIQKEKLFPMPDYDLSRHNQVRVTVYGKVLNENYTKILFENPDMDLDTVYLLDKVQKGESISRSEATELRKLGLIEGKIPKLFISATVAEALDQKAQYIKNKGFDDQYYIRFPRFKHIKVKRIPRFAKAGGSVLCFRL